MTQRDRTSILVLTSTLGGLLLLILLTQLDARDAKPEIFGRRFGRDDVDVVLGLSTLATFLIGLAAIGVRQFSDQISSSIKDKLHKAGFIILLTIAVITSVTAVGQYTVIRGHYFDAGDTYHYYLGPKYFKELGYNDLYLATIMAGEENGESFHGRRVRDLVSNQKRRVTNLLTEAERIRVRQAFNDARWAEFKQDIATYRSWHSERSWARRMLDHGYNGSPVWNAFAGFIANRVPITETGLTLVAQFNLIAIVIMFALLPWAFGWQLGLLFVILFWVNICDRYILGGAFLRYTWIAALISGLCCMKKGHYAWAGGLIAIAAGLNVFPIFFVAGIGIKMAYDFIHDKVIRSEHWRFAVSAAATGLVLFMLASSTGRGVHNWPEFLDQMDVEARYANGRIGFVYNFLYPKDVLPNDPPPRFMQEQIPRYLETHADVFSLQNLRLMLTVLILAALIRLRKHCDDLEFTILLGFASFFMIFSTVRYYYAGFVGLPLLWHARYHRLDGQVMLGILLGVMLIGYWIYDEVSHGFLHNTLFTAVFTTQLLLTVWIFSYLPAPTAISEYSQGDDKAAPADQIPDRTSS